MMDSEWVDAIWLDENAGFSLSELTPLCGFSESELHELLECGALVAGVGIAGTPVFSGSCVRVLQTASRLRRDFELDLQAAALTLGMLERIAELEARLHQLQARLPGITAGQSRDQPWRGTVN